MDQEDAEESLKIAKEIIKIHEDKISEEQPLGKRIRVRPNTDRPFLQQLIFREVFNSKVETFPSDDEWKVIWNRLIDSERKEEIHTRLLKIEKSIFLNIRGEVEDLFEEKWSGTKQQNQCADFKVALSIKQSFRAYERDHQKPVPFFKFTK